MNGFDRTFISQHSMPAGCIYDVSNKRIIYNHPAVGTADCSVLLECLCHTDTHAPSSSPTTSPTSSPTNNPTSSPTSGVCELSALNQYITSANVTGVVPLDLEYTRIRQEVFDPFRCVVFTGSVRIAYVDFDNDGDDDAVASQQDGSIMYMENKDGFLHTQPESANPFFGIDTSGIGFPSFGDVDGDGDKDLLVGHEDGTISYFENENRVIRYRIGSDNPFDGMDVGNTATPVLVDLDGDLDLDLVVGSASGDLKMFENTGMISAAVFTELTGSLNPFNNMISNNGDWVLNNVQLNKFGEVGNYRCIEDTNGLSNNLITRFQKTNIAFGECNPLIPNDCLNNVLTCSQACENDATCKFFNFNFKQDNVHPGCYLYSGDACNPNTEAGDLTADNDIHFFYKMSERSSTTPAFYDYDNDGDSDLIVGTSDGTLNAFDNIGSLTHVNQLGMSVEARFSYRALNNDTFAQLNVAYNAAPAFGNIKGTGMKTLSIPFDISPPPTSAPTTTVTISAASTSSTNNLITTFQVFQNSGWYQYSLTNVSGFQPVTKYRSVPRFVDLDGDSNMDLVVGQFDGTLEYIYNDGSNYSVDGEDHVFQGVIADSGYAAPEFLDLDNDGRTDLILGEEDGTISFYKNIGTTTGPIFTSMLGWDNPFYGIDVGNNAVPACVDLNGDGLLDCAVGELTGSIRFLRNNGTSFEHVTDRTDNPFDYLDVGSYASPTFAYVNSDSFYDLVVGNKKGQVMMFVNQGNSTHPRYHHRSAYTMRDDNGDEIINEFFASPTTWIIPGDTKESLVVAKSEFVPEAEDVQYRYIVGGGLFIGSLLSLAAFTTYFGQNKKMGVWIGNQMTERPVQYSEQEFQVPMHIAEPVDKFAPKSELDQVKLRKTKLFGSRR